ncbi:Reticulon-like protein [Rhynchospora pubera]|uniref:Reticulon-like protein n=1 Tax=Rhynchospora pubera TaxID=906938 RepID=A0AAV8D4Q4_9POAL|nr:Reticulon-like protein [Rhynchospora pubera]
MAMHQHQHLKLNQQHQASAESDVAFFGEFKSSQDSSQSHLINSPPPHHLLPPGFVADVILWRRKEAAISALIAVVSAWLVFQVWGYTLLSLFSNVLLLLLSILFLWAKAAQLLNRPPPPVPEIEITEDAVKEAALYLQSILNKLLSAFKSIAHGNDSDLFYASASVLWFLSIIGSFTCFVTAFYICLLVILIVPALYDKYRECIDRCLSLAYTEVLMYERIYERFCFQCYRKVKESIREMVEEDS